MEEAELVAKIIPTLTNAPVSNATVAAISKELMKSMSGTSSPVYYFIDAGIYLLVFLLMTQVTRLYLRIFSRKEADNTKLKAFFGTLAVLLIAAGVAGAANTRMLLLIAAVPATAMAAMLLRHIFWISSLKALALAVVILASGAALSSGLMKLANLYMPEGRVTLMQRIKVSLKFIDDYHGKQGEEVFNTNMVKTILSGLSVQKEAWAGAIQLLRNPDLIKEMTAEHEEDLRALDLITDGKMPSAEELLELGITDDEKAQAAPGMKVLAEVKPGTEVSEADVAAVVGFLKTVRGKDAQDVTAEDVAVVIREAMKHRAEADKKLADLESLTGDSQAGKFPVFPDLWGDETNELWESSFQFMGPLPPAGLVKERVIAAEPIDPYAGLSAKERSEWRASRGRLDVTAYFSSSADKMVLVNGQIVRTGGVMVVKSGERNFAWRLKNVGDYTAEWEPVVDLSRANLLEAPGVR